MAGDAANAVLGVIAQRVITPVVDAIGRQFVYLFCYKSNIKKVKKVAAQLEKSRNDADTYFQAHEWNNVKRAESSAAWLKDVEEVTKAAKQVEESITQLNGWCLNLTDKYVPSRKSAKLAAVIQKLQAQAPKGITISPALPAGRLPGASCNAASEGYGTRMATVNEVMKALEDPAVNVIGICGLGGVGKTTIVHEVRERTRKKNLFDEVAMTVVSQDQDLFKIQGDLAEMLGLTSLVEEKNVIGRADKLHKRLTSSNNVLVILDDVWSDIQLRDVGIPVGSGNRGCKVVITSRQQFVCADIQKHIEVQVLPKEEARCMFKKTAGECVEREYLKELANEIADECGGLPIALSTLAKALSNKERKAWEDALKQLREGSLTSIHGMERNVYQSIKLSYDFLAIEKLEQAQSLLLLCCQHLEDAEIKVEKLARYCLALELFEGVGKVVHARNRVYSLIEHLKSCFLLQAVDIADRKKELKDATVKVHDVVRDVCLSLVSRVKEERGRVYMQSMARELNDGYELGTTEVDYPKLKLLVQAPLDDGLTSKSLLEGMKDLRVFENLQELKHQPLPALQVLTNLRMLSLEGAILHKDAMSVIGRLTKLETLSLLGSEVDSFPCQIAQLSNLKLLDLRCREGSGPIPSGILHGLIKLEVLHMGNYYFSGTPDNGEKLIYGETHGCVVELDSLSNLTTIQVQLSDPMELLDLQQFCFEKLERFYFGSVGHNGRFFEGHGDLCPLVERTLELEEVGMEWVSGAKVQFIIQNTVDLNLQGIKDWSDPLLREKFVCLRELCLTSCNDLKYIIHDGDGVDDETTEYSGGRSNVFMNLEMLCIRRMDNIRELCSNGNLPPGSLGKLQQLCMDYLPEMRHLWVGPTDPLCLANLKKVEIWRCSELESIFPYSAAKCLVQLQTLKVGYCEMLEGIFSNGREEGITGSGDIKEEISDLIYHFPRLRKVELQFLPKLQGFYDLRADDDDEGRVEPLSNPLVKLPSLEKLICLGMDKLKQIVGRGILDIHKFAASDWLQNLEMVEIESCDSLESVFDFKGKQVIAENAHVLTLGKLQEIKLSKLRSLTNIFLCRMQDVSVPKLRSIEVEKCGNLVNVVASNMIKRLQNLKRVYLDNCESVKAVFDFEGFEFVREDAHAILGELEYCTLRRLPQLEHVFRLVPGEIHGFQNLRSLRLDTCGGMSYLLSSSMARMLVNLESLIVEKCESVKEVIKTNKDCGNKKILLRSFSTVTLGYLKNLSSFCSSDQHEFNFPSLEKVSIIQCPEMKTFCCRPLTAEKLHGVDFFYFRSYGNKLHEFIWKGDLNETVLHCYTRVNQMNSNLKEDGVGDSDAEDFDDIYDPEECIGDEHVHCSNEGASSNLTKPLVATLIVSSPDALLDPLAVSSSPAVIEGKKELASLSSKPNLVKAASPPHIVLSHSPGSIQGSLKLSGDFLVLSEADKVLSDSPDQPEKLLPVVSHTEEQAREVDDSSALASWEGHMVTRRDKELLEAVEKHFPDTFDGVNFHSEFIWEIALETFCRCLLKFLVANVYDLSSKEVAELRAMLLDLETFKFRVDWALERLGKVEKLSFRSPFLEDLADIEIQRAPLLAKVEYLEAEMVLMKEELRNLDVLRETKITTLFDEFGTDVLYLLKGSLGRDLLPSYYSR